MTVKAITENPKRTMLAPLWFVFFSFAVTVRAQSHRKVRHSAHLPRYTPLRLLLLLPVKQSPKVMQFLQTISAYKKTKNVGT